MLLDKVFKVKLLKIALAKHDIAYKFLDRSEPHNILSVQVPEEEPPSHQEPVSEKLFHKRSSKDKKYVKYRKVVWS